ncbi:unnamed protein product [Phytomonas sp. Hart1]|nr:unnamed protein product [Phytomonas sp. Hart1]|eukprot:CCW68057.1 unnamed protein product [Phytomonas sp. isolate Hart1]
MKTVSEWLATSSDDDDAIGNSHLNAKPSSQSKKEQSSSPSQGDPPSTFTQNVLLNAASPISTVSLPKTDNISTQATAPEALGEVSQGPPPGYRAVEVMVVDRGTQTMSTVSTQTDPLPPHTNNWGTRECFMNPCGVHAPNGMPFGNSQGIKGAGVTGNPISSIISQRPYYHLLQQVEADQSHSITELKHQLALIQNTVDTLISRYNLPPPPFSPLL